MLAKVTKKELETYFVPFIPKNKRGFSSKICPVLILQCIIHKLKTGCQWSFLFLDIEVFKPNFSYQLVYYYYRKWSKADVFQNAYEALLKAKRAQLEISLLNLDGTHTLCKKGGEEVAYQGRKKGKTSNMLILTDARGYPLGFGEAVSGNHNDLFDIKASLQPVFKSLKQQGFDFKTSILNADKGFDSKSFRRFLQRRAIRPNIKDNPRNRKGNKRGKKRFFDQDLYKKRFINERTFAWLDSFRSLLIRFDTSLLSWHNFHFLAFFLVLIKV